MATVRFAHICEPAAAWANVSRSMTRAKQADKLIELLEAA